MDKHYEILILGGGTAGLTVASQLADRIGGEHIAVVEPSLEALLPAAVDAGRRRHLPAGRVGARRGRPHPGRRHLDPGCGDVRSIRSTARVHTAASGTLTYDFLVVAAGVVSSQWTKIPGLAESVGKPGTGVVSNYSYETVASTWEAIRIVPRRHGALHRADRRR